MTIHQCPKCELRFDWKTELDDHCWHDHPAFRHEYPASAPLPPPADTPAAAAHPEPPETKRRRHTGEALVRWMVPR